MKQFVIIQVRDIFTEKPHAMMERETLPEALNLAEELLTEEGRDNTDTTYKVQILEVINGLVMRQLELRNQ